MLEPQPLAASSFAPVDVDGVSSDGADSFLQKIRDRYRSGTEIIDSLKALQSLKVVIIGDTIIDEYVYCEPLGQSLKSPLIVHQYLGEERFCGGVIAVANQMAIFCKEVHVVTVLGAENSHEDYIRSHLRENVTAQFFTRDDAPTVLKRRFVYSDVERKVFEVCYINDRQISPELEAQICDYIAETVPRYDTVAVSDFGHGLMAESIVATARKNARSISVNAQTNSANLGYNLITKKYSGLDLACVDETEARLALHEKHDSIESVGHRLLDELNAAKLIITRGRHGSLGFEPGREICVAPALTTRIVDRVGAGDAYFAMSVLCVAAKMPLDAISLIGNCIGALAVQTVANRESIATKDLFSFILRALK